MKLYYDTFVPFMPDSDIVEGEVVHSDAKAAGRKAMIELSAFQSEGEISHLYNAIIHACVYQNKDLVEEILNIPDDIEIPNVSITEAVDICAKMLFRSINPANEFNLDSFVAILLNTCHFAIEAIKKEKAAKASDVSIEEGRHADGEG